MSDYYEVLLEGDVEVMRGFIVGYLTGAGVEEPFYVAKECGVEHDSLAREVAEWIHLASNRTHIVTAENVYVALTEGIANAGEALHLQLVSARRLRGAHFSFEWEVYTREEAERADGLVEQRPASIRVDEYEPEEEVHEDVKGETGMYAPTHAYTMRAFGHAHGKPGEIISWAEQLRDDPFIKLSRIELQYADGEEDAGSDGD